MEMEINMEAKIAGVLAVQETGLMTDDENYSGFLHHATELSSLMKHLRLKMTDQQREYFSNTAVIFGGLSLIIAAKHDPMSKAMLDMIMEVGSELGLGRKTK